MTWMKSAFCALKTEIDRLSKNLKESKGRESEFANMIRMLKIPDRAGEQKTVPSTSKPPPAAATNAGPETAAAPDSKDTRKRGGPPFGRPGDRESLRERIKEAADLWRVRSDLARNSFIQNTKLTAEQAQRFATLTEAMNIRIGHEIDQFAAQVKEGGRLSPESGARLFNSLSGAFVLTYDEMDRSMPEGWRESSGKDFDLVDFVDPEVATPLIDIEDQIRDRQDKNRQRRPF
jgi:hypothetical protein